MFKGETNKEGNRNSPFEQHRNNCCYAKIHGQKLEEKKIFT